MTCACCGSLRRFDASDERAKGAKWLEDGRPVELVVVPDNSLVTSKPVFWDGIGRWVDDLVVFSAGRRGHIAMAHCAFFAWSRTMPETLLMRTGLHYPKLSEAEAFDARKVRALCDVVVLEFVKRMNHARSCGTHCECLDVSCDTKEWAKGPNWELMTIRLTVSRDLEDSHLSIDDHSGPIC